MTAPSNSAKLIVRFGLLLAVVTAMALIYLLILAVDQESLTEQNISFLLILNGLVAALLLCGIVLVGWRLRQRLKAERFGSKLLIKLAAIFALVGVLPGILIYSVSYQFVSRSIESWFDVRVETALEAGLNLGRSSLDAFASDTASRVRASLPALDVSIEGNLALSLDKLREQLGADDAQVWSQSGVLVASSGESRFQLSSERPTALQMKSLKSQRSIQLFEGLEEAGKPGTAGKPAKLKVLVSLGSAGLDLQTSRRYLVISQKLPVALVTNAVAVQTAYSEYQARALSRAGLQKMYLGTLTLSLFLSVLAAFILAAILGNQLVQPLLILALGVQKVSLGDLSPNLKLTGNNELADLTRSFASMTEQLAQARVAEQKAERVKAWNEVAQRVAHEIKNPLTPIQLSAERLSLKLADKLDGADAALLNKSVKTIVDQVDAMKRLVNEFRDYARLPAAELKPMALQSAVQDALQLFEHELQTGLISFDPMPWTEGEDLIEGDAQQLVQAIHNLLQNAIEAVGGNEPSIAEGAKTIQPKPATQPKPAVHIKLGLIGKTEQANAPPGWVFCEISDNGPGFAPAILARAFEPYNTTKPKGTGLGLAVVRKTIQEHKGEIVLSNREEVAEALPCVLGAVIRLTFPHISKGNGA